MKYDFDFLQQELGDLGASAQEHSGRTLLDHLIGVHNLLVSWEASSTVSLAGLFHSIYGTSTFLPRTLTLEQRSKIRELIGNKSEHIAYLFCACDQKDLFQNASKSSKAILYDRLSGRLIRISRVTFCALVEVGAANLIDQFPRVRETFSIVTCKQLLEKWCALDDFLSTAAHRALEIARDSLDTLQA